MRRNRQRGTVCRNQVARNSPPQLRGNGDKLALTVKLLKGMGIDEDKIEAIIAAHTETTEGLKSERDTYKKQAEQVPDLQKQLEEAKAAEGDSDGWEEKFNAEHQAFEDFKAQVEAEKADAEKAQAYRGMLMAAGIDPKRIDAIMRVTDLSEVEMEDGKLKDSDKLQESAKEEWSDFVLKTHVQGSNPETPPTAKKGGIEGADPEIVKRIQERHERLYGKTDTKE